MTTKKTSSRLRAEKRRGDLLCSSLKDTPLHDCLNVPRQYVLRLRNTQSDDINFSTCVKGDNQAQKHQADWHPVDPAASGPALCVCTESGSSWVCSCLMSCAIRSDLTSMQHLRVRFHLQQWVIPFGLLYGVA